jgi:hypothetical protein
MEAILAPSDGSSSPTPTTPTLNETMFSGETFSSGNGDEIAVEPLECSSDGKDENCKHCE